MPKNLGQYNNDLSVPRKKDIDDLANVVDGKYSATNPPPYPVTSVNGQTGAVTVESGGVNIVTQPNQPSGQSSGDFWYETELNALMFTSPSEFTISCTRPGWDGTLEYSMNGEEWIEWDGSQVSSGGTGEGQCIYFRGSGNTKITGAYSGSSYRWNITGTSVSCNGNIENLLDYQTVAVKEHPRMIPRCYSYMFYQCAALIAPPELPATTLATECYYSMFESCRNLTTAPELPATTLAASCYIRMFYGCISITTAPALPATTLASNCYNNMFYYCTGLIAAPELPATTLAGDCYASMFHSCRNLKTAPALPANALPYECYANMFYNCTSLTAAPELPATTLGTRCYNSMFYNCTSLTTAPELPATTLTSNCYQYMFYNCTNLATLPSLPATTLTGYCYYEMFYGCTKIKLATTQTGEYTQPYRIPTSGDGATGNYSLDDMFTGTGGTFTGTPSINTTYYLSSSNTIV